MGNAAPGGEKHFFWATRSERVVIHAGYANETNEYGHGVLGPLRDTKYLSIHMRPADNSSMTCPKGVALMVGQVFEDVAPLIADVTGDIMPEIIAVQSDIRQGSRLVIYDLQGIELAATLHIGQRNRWLAPIGAADLDGDGYVEIAYIDRPHLAKTLTVWRYVDGELVRVTAASGLTNHRIGETDIAGGIRDCGQGPEMITANADWSRIMATRLVDGALQARDLGRHDGRDSFAAAMGCERLPQ